MKKALVILMIILGGCSSWHNSKYDASVDRDAAFTKDRDECRERAKKAANSEPLNDIRHLKNYDAMQSEYTLEVNAFNRCMSSKGWIKK